jgi:hypothetical protein
VNHVGGNEPLLIIRRHFPVRSRCYSPLPDRPMVP